MHRLPVLSIDNMQIINRCTHGPDIIGDVESDFQMARAFVKSKLPFCDQYLITTFFTPEVRKPKTSLFPPILRPEILAAKAHARRGDHLLVYQTAEGHDDLADTLQKTGLECRVYGMRRGIIEEQVEGNLRYRPFAEAGFIEDLASARAVIAGGGFTLMGEAVYLHKPMLAVPIAKQFEQVMNARYLQKLGLREDGLHPRRAAHRARLSRGDPLVRGEARGLPARAEHPPHERARRLPRSRLRGRALSTGNPRGVSCVFCDIIADPSRACVVLDDRDFLAFLDHRPVFPGHCLLVPKVHTPTLAELPPELHAPLVGHTQTLMRAVEAALGAEGTFVATNNKVSQSVPHLHMHVVPRKKKDGLRGFFWPRQPYASEEAMRGTAEGIRKAIG